MEGWKLLVAACVTNIPVAVNWATYYTASQSIEEQIFSPHHKCKPSVLLWFGTRDVWSVMLLEDGGLHFCCGGRIKIWWFLLIVTCWNLAMASSCRNQRTALWVRQTLSRSFSLKMEMAVSDTWLILRTVWYVGILLLACYPQKCRQWWISLLILGSYLDGYVCLR
jgi:hypothetical protein